MSTFRQNFTPAPPAPRSNARGWLAFHVVVCALIVAACYAGRQPAQATPEAFPPVPVALDAHTLMQIRQEAFQAGLTEGLGQGCSAPRLGKPLEKML